MKRNFKALQMKTIASLGGGAIKGTLSFINESFGESHCAKQWQEIRLPRCIRPDSWDVNISLSIDSLLLWCNSLILK